MAKIRLFFGAVPVAPGAQGGGGCPGAPAGSGAPHSLQNFWVSDWMAAWQFGQYLML